ADGLFAQLLALGKKYNDELGPRNAEQIEFASRRGACLENRTTLHCSAFRLPRSAFYRGAILLALKTNPTATAVAAPITLCHSHETDGAPKFTTPTAAIPAIRPKNAPVARARGIMARRKTPSMDP